MNQKFFPGSNSAKSSKRHLVIRQGLSFIGGLSILSSGLGGIQAIASTDTLVIFDTPAPTAKPESTNSSKIPKSSPIIVPQSKPVLQADPIKPNTPKISPKPSSVYQSQPTAAPKVQLSAPKILAPSSSKPEDFKAVSQPLSPYVQPQKIQLAPSATTQGQNSYIDTTSYGQASNQKVILTERSTGCQTISQNGQLHRGSCGGAVARKNPPATAMQALVAPRRVRLANRQHPSSTQGKVARSFTASPQVQPIRMKGQPVSPEQVVSLQPIARQGLSIGLEPIPQYNRAASLYAAASPQGVGRTDLIFPLPIVANITSAFGWRIHPIAGTARMHNGTDLGASLGTPVLAAYQGEVSTADWNGGYGLTVILKHQEGTQESLYAHLSEIYVQPGEWVEQGTVIGRVGNTGYSTGPHLHFEWRHLTEQGWVAVDAGVHLEYALENLMRSKHLAETPTVPQG